MAIDVETRIRQFKQMAESDPDNELGHFSLGKAYLEAERFTDAVASLQRVMDINPKMSKAYHLLGEAYHKDGKRDDAIKILTHGAGVADEQGDRMPRDAMVALLKDWGAAVPAFQETSSSATSQEETGASTTGFSCARCSKPSGQLPKPPIKGPLGQKIFDNICDTCWREWIAMGTKVINEMGLALANPQARDTYDQYMVEFLQIEDR